MTFRLSGERVSVTLPDGPVIAFWPLLAWPIAFNASMLVAAYNDADSGAAEVVALRNLYRTFVEEALPEWDIADHRGPILPTPEGMWRLPLSLALGLLSAWLDTLNPTPSAVDATVPPGPLRDELNRKLRSRRKSE